MTRSGSRLKASKFSQRFLPFLVEIAVAWMMIAALIEAQIIRPIVRTFPVPMMNGFVGTQCSSDFRRHNHVMLKDVALASFGDHVKPRLQGLRQRPLRDQCIPVRQVAAASTGPRGELHVALATPCRKDASTDRVLNYAWHPPARTLAFRAHDLYMRHTTVSLTFDHSNVVVVNAREWLVLAQPRADQVTVIRTSTRERALADRKCDLGRTGLARRSTHRAGNVHGEMWGHTAHGGPVDLRVQRASIEHHSERIA